jgi:hypothetical protein
MTAINNYDLTNPFLYYNAGDSSTGTVMSALLTQLSFTPTLGSPTASPPSVANLDAFLGSEDVILIGGPKATTYTLALQQQLYPSVFDVNELNFLNIVSSNGRFTAPNSAAISVSNDYGNFTLKRNANNEIITDYAIIAKATGTTRRLMYIAGIRDIGTALAVRILNLVQNPSLWSVPFGPKSILYGWTDILNTYSSVAISFQINSQINYLSEVEFNSLLVGTLTEAYYSYTSIVMTPLSELTTNNP